MTLSAEAQARIQSNVSQALAWLFAAFRHPAADFTPDLVDSMIDQATKMAWTGGLLTGMVMPPPTPASDTEQEEGESYARQIATSAVNQLLRLEGPAPLAEIRRSSVDWVVVLRESGKFLHMTLGPEHGVLETDSFFDAEPFETLDAATEFLGENGIGLHRVEIKPYRRYVSIKAYES